MFRNALLLAAIVFSSVAFGQAADATLSGTVVGANNKPKPGVAVDVLGPARVFTETDPSGKFSVAVVAGTYVVRIRDGSRRMEFPAVVPDGKPQTFKLTW